jgi:bifunctional non-homologous end joining protein LigD
MTDLVERLVPDELWTLFRRVVPSTEVIRPQGGGRRLAADGIEAYAKSSGSKGPHLLAAVAPTPSAEVSAYAKGLAVEAERALPRRAVHRLTRSLRPGKVFVDWSQNAGHKTTATPCTLRSRTGPTVSAPVTWAEVEACRTPDRLAFQAPDIPPRVQEFGDLLAPLFDADRAGPLP